MGHPSETRKYSYMKIGIITILHVNNYGAELQAYATQKAIKQLGHNAEIINYLFYKNPCHKREALTKPQIPLTRIARLKEWLFPKIEAIRLLPYRQSNMKRKKHFEDFHTTNTSISPIYRNMTELLASQPDYDIYVTGSDQVWNLGINSSLDPYFLTFAPKGKRRMAYASSFGVEQISDTAKRYYHDRLQGYSSIGVREQNAVNLVKELSEKDAQWVLDPTLLLDKTQWLEVARPVEQFTADKFVLIYELTSCDYIKKLALQLAKDKGIKVVRICKDAVPVEMDGSIINITTAGPAEFLYLFSKAALVITNSFHGTAFSINFQRPFYTVLSLRKQNNSRQRSLLNMFDLADRLLVEGSEMPLSSVIDIDYKRVNAILDEERRKSLNFLTNAINGN